jgi:DeoR/GlpR family transcriptional regulator of sugar metabolism
MIAEKRRQEILRLIEEQGSIRISNLGKRFNVTDMTIRRDIDFLSDLGMVKRVHGGAISEGEGNINLATTFLKRNREYKPEKERIGTRAQDFVENNTTIIIDGGSTNECFANKLDPQKKLRIVTHGLNIAWILSENENHELFVPGGILNRLTMTFTGREVESIYEELNADILFLSASGVSLAKGLTDPAWLDTSIKKAMIRSSKKVVLLIDSHKFELVSSRTFAALQEVDTIITDESLGEDTAGIYRENGINLIIV